MRTSSVLDHAAAGESECWPVAERSVDPNGYGRARRRGRTVLAHRASYEMHVGPIPSGMVLDHICHNQDASCPGGSACLHRRCVNPDHLEPVTQRENLFRSEKTPARINAEKTTCPHGHPYDAANTYRRRSGARDCRRCAKHGRRPSVVSPTRTHAEQLALDETIDELYPHVGIELDAKTLLRHW